MKYFRLTLALSLLMAELAQPVSFPIHWPGTMGPVALFSAQRAGNAIGQGEALTRLPDGRWLKTGGRERGLPSARAFLGDLRSRTVTRVSNPLTYARFGRSATLLPNGTVLIFGGWGADGEIVSQAELFDPAMERFEILGETGLSLRAYHSATLLTDGRVVFMGGLGGNRGLVEEVELWDPASRAVQRLPLKVQTARYGHEALLLPSGGFFSLGVKTWLEGCWPVRKSLTLICSSSRRSIHFRFNRSESLRGSRPPSQRMVKPTSRSIPFSPCVSLRRFALNRSMPPPSC